ncbi:hypothetical protein [Nostoc sp.]|uniref:hypothetical protein n=1 Tax=Nostoc sp. TaxID=1180 RepID=UPI002FF50632
MLGQDCFNDELLKKRVDVFYGYGNYKGNYWFIGMEERGEDFQDINKRINIWSNRGKYEIDDIAEYHIDMGTWDERIQPTWNKLIRIVLSAKEKENIDLENVRKYQINELGRKDKETCLLELFPLPSRSLNDWIFNPPHTQLSFLSNRGTYEKYCLEKRINYISQRIKEHQPKAVVFYGVGYEPYWRKITEKITDVEFSRISEGFLICRSIKTVFVMAKHPVSRGLTNEYFHNIGRSISAKITE